MADCIEPGCAKVDPLETSYIANWNAILGANEKNLDVSVLMAVCKKESENKYFWVGNETLYGQNKLVLQNHTKLKYFEMEKYVAVAAIPGGAKRIPKWRFEPGWWHEVNTRPDYKGFSPEEKAVFSCSFGIAQQSAFYYTADMAVDNKMPGIQIFCRNANLQHAVLLKEMRRLLRLSGGSHALAYTKYNFGASHKTPEAYGDITLGFEVYIKEWLVKRGYKTCLV